MALKWTMLRHQVLTLISRGGVERARVGELTWTIPDGCPARQGHQQRAVSDLVHAGAARIVRGETPYGGPVAVTAAGAQLLTNWDAARGPALVDGKD